MHSVLNRVVAGIYLATLTAFGFFIRTVDWSQIEKGLALGPGCPLRRTTGLLCAFCGMTHSWIAVFKGDIGRALQENLLGPFVLAASNLWAIVMLTRKKPFNWHPRAAVLILAVLLTYAVARNIAGKL